MLGVVSTELRNENDDFIISARERYGYTGKKQAQKLVEEMGGLFAGGELSDEDLDGVMKAFQDYYWKAKEDNKKYTQEIQNRVSTVYGILALIEFICQRVDCTLFGKLYLID